MNSGELTEKVVLLRPVVKEVNGFGERETVYEPVKPALMMKVSDAHGGLKAVHDVNVQDYSVAFTCYYRYRDLFKIDESMRLRWEGHDYKINSIVTRRRRNEMEMQCDRVNSSERNY